MIQKTGDVRQIAYCPHCGNKATQTLVFTQLYYEKSYSLSDGQENEFPAQSFVARCETCCQLLIYIDEGAHCEENQFHRAELRWPHSGRLHVCVPEKIRNIYLEASRIKQIEPNQFAAQIRRAIEAICEDRGVTKGNLYFRIEELVKKGDLPSVLAQTSHILRDFGNIGAHASDESVHPLQVDALDEFFRLIVEHIYIVPWQLERFRK